VPTRWNSDYQCLAAHVHFEKVVRMLTADPLLASYALTGEQWELAHKLLEVLEVKLHMRHFDASR
jgi:hypothetical protein